MTEVDRSIGGVAKTIAEVLEKKKYSIDYYQREYKWESKQIAELVADLTAKFLELYEPDHARKDVAKYPGYFLGSIIISQKGSQPFIVDGQQRLTSLTLFLTYLRRRHCCIEPSGEADTTDLPVDSSRHVPDGHHQCRPSRHKGDALRRLSAAEPQDLR